MSTGKEKEWIEQVRSLVDCGCLSDKELVDIITKSGWDLQITLNHVMDSLLSLSSKTLNPTKNSTSSSSSNLRSPCLSSSSSSSSSPSASFFQRKNGHREGTSQEENKKDKKARIEITESFVVHKNAKFLGTMIAYGYATVRGQKVIQNGDKIKLERGVVNISMLFFFLFSFFFFLFFSFLFFLLLFSFLFFLFFLLFFFSFFPFNNLQNKANKTPKELLESLIKTQLSDFTSKEWKLASCHLM